MTYATIMINLEPGQSNARLLAIGAELITRFDAHVIGIAVSQPMQMMYGDGFVSAEVVGQDIKTLEADQREAEHEFRVALQAHAAKVTWRVATVFGGTADYIAREARCANLLLTGAQTDRLTSPARSTDTGELVLQAGRPVLIVPATAEPLTLDHLLVAWKDTREARRAVLDAIPMLKKAVHVTVVEIATESELSEAHRRVEDVARWLARQGIAAEPMASHSNGNDMAWLESLAHRQKCDMIVAGAYGHSRFREWIMGGFTKTLLHSTTRCALLSH